MVAPPSGVVIAFKKSAREARSTTGVPMMPMEPTLVQPRSVCRHRSAYISLPDNAAVRSVERIHIIRFGHRNDHWPAAWTALDVKRLRVNVAYDRAVKVQVARQIRRSRLREGRIDIKAITRTMVVILGNVDLRVCWKNCAPQTYSDNAKKWKIQLSSVRGVIPALPSTTIAPIVKPL